MKKSILITGCSSGIGLCAAQTLRKRGYRVFATARKLEDVVKLANMGFESTQLDLDDSTSIQKALTFVLQSTEGTLDALFNNAGYGIPGAVEDLSRDMMRAQFETNVFGVMELTNLVIPIMRKQGYGRIVHNTSILGIITMPFRGAYNASKFALEGFTNTLRQELRDTGLFVSTIVPGPIQSQFRKNAQAQYQENLSDKNSVHQPVYIKMMAYFSKTSSSENIFSLGPEAVAKKLIHALESAHPKAHYYVGFSAHLFAFLRRILPDGMMDWLVYKINRGEIK